MNDYLNNLVARHLNLIEVIQPRLPSRFEPPSVASPLDADLSGSPEDHETLEASNEVESDSVEPDRQQATVRKAEREAGSHSLAIPPSRHPLMPEPLAQDDLQSSPPQNPARMRGTSLLPTEDVEQPTTERSTTLVEDRARRIDQPASKESTHSSRPDRAASLPSRPSSSAQAGVLPTVPPPQAMESETVEAGNVFAPQASLPPQPPGTTPTPERAIVPAEARRPDPAERSGPKDQAIERVEHEGREREHAPEPRRSIKSTEIEPPPAQPQHRHGAAALIVEPRVTRYAEAEDEAESRHAPNVAPTINVTIGRLEVRAVAPAPVAVARRQSAPTPPTSLDHYLRQRAGGGDR